MLKLRTLIKSTFIKKNYRKINDTRTSTVADSQVLISSSPVRYLSNSKVMTKETDPCDLSINYTTDYAELYSSEVLQASARNSLIDLRCEAQMYLDSSRRAANKKHKELASSQPDSLSKKPDQLVQLIQSMHESMNLIRAKLETVDKKYETSESLNRDLKDSVLDLKEKVTELKMSKDCECVHKCVIV